MGPKYTYPCDHHMRWLQHRSEIRLSPSQLYVVPTWSAHRKPSVRVSPCKSPADTPMWDPDGYQMSCPYGSNVGFVARPNLGPMWAQTGLISAPLIEPTKQPTFAPVGLHVGSTWGRCGSHMGPDGSERQNPHWTHMGRLSGSHMGSPSGSHMDIPSGSHMRSPSG